MGGRKRTAKKAELETFLEQLHSSDCNSSMSQAEYLSVMREKLKECSNSGTSIPERRTYILEKLCEVCGDFRHDDQLLLCDYCDDAYHTFCLTPALVEVPGENEDWFCKACIDQKCQLEKEKQKRECQNNKSNNGSSKVQTLLESYNFNEQLKDTDGKISNRRSAQSAQSRSSRNSLNQEVQKCGECRDLVLLAATNGVKEPSEKCVSCNLVFHQACFNKKKDSILCTKCSNNIIKSIPKTQKLIDQYFSNKSAEKDIKNLRNEDIEDESTSSSTLTQATQSVKKNKNKTKESLVDDKQLNSNLSESNKRTTRNGSCRNTRSQCQKQILQSQDSELSDDSNATIANEAFLRSSGTSQNGLAKKFKRNDSSALVKINQNDTSLTQPINGNITNSSNNSATLSNSSTENKNKKKNMQFSLPIPSKDPQITIKCRQSLIFALKAKNIEFCDDLSYSDICPSSSNNANLESHLQVLDIANTMRFHAFKELTRKGQYVPVAVEEDKIQGFVVRAQEDIKLGTLITEYVGEVDFARNNIFNKSNDSIMDLLRTPRSRTSLVILPNRKGNLARFLSGINNQSAKSRAKQNVQSARFNIAGSAHVLLFAKKNIKKGSLLYYDYNAGGYGEYPTQDFI